MGESLSKSTSQKLDKNTIAMLKDAHLRICSHAGHNSTVSSVSTDASEEKEKDTSSHQGFSKSQLVHCLRESSPPKVDSAISQRLFTLMAGQKRKVHFTPFAAAYYIATVDAEALPHALFLVCDLNGDCAVSAGDIDLWLQAGGIADAEAMRKAFVEAAGEQYKTRDDVKEIPAEGMDETAFNAALSKSDVACSAELKKAFRSIVDRLTTANPMPKLTPLSRLASEAAGESDGVLSPRSADDDSASVDASDETKKKKKKSHHEHGKHKRSSTVAVVSSTKDTKDEQKDTPSELKKSTVISSSQSAITEDFSDDEEELARRKPINFVIKSAEEAAAESSKVDISTLALKPPQLSQSLRVSSRGRRPSVMNSQNATPNSDIFGSPLSPRSPTSAQPTVNDFFGANDANKTTQAAQPFDANSVFGDNPFGDSKPADKSNTSLFDNAPFGEPAKPADDKGAATQTSLFTDNPFGEPAKPADDKSQTSLFTDNPFGEPAKPADDKSQTSLFTDSPFGEPAKPSEEKDKASQTSLFSDNPFGEPAKPAEDKDKASQTSLFSDNPFGEPAKPADDKGAETQTSLFTDNPFGEPAKPADEKPASQTSLFDNAFEAKTDEKPAEAQTSLFGDSSFNPEPAKTGDDKSAEAQTSLFGDTPFGETKPTDATKTETKPTEPKPAASQNTNLFSDLSSFSQIPHKPLPKPNEEPKPATPAESESDNPFDGSFMDTKPLPQPVAAAPAKQQQGLTPALKSSLSKGLASLEGAKFDEACFAFKFLCGQVRESAPEKVSTIVNYYVACLAMKSLTSSLGAGQTPKDLPKDKQDQLAAIATAITQLKLHPTHKRAMLAVAAVFSDYAYTQFARENGAEVPNSMNISCTHTCWKCHELCDTSLPRCISCGEPISLTADSLQVVTNENVSSLRRCSECHCFFSEVSPSDANCPICDGALQ